MSRLDRDDRYGKHSKQMFKAAATLLRYGGFRVGELTLLRVDDIVSLRYNRSISLPNVTKTRTARDVYFNDDAIDEILDACSYRIEQAKQVGEYLFCTSSSRFSRRNAQSFTRTLNTMLHDLLGEQYTTHSFREGHITDMRRAGVSAKIIQVHIGHRNVATTLRYEYVSDTDIRLALAAL